MRILAILLGVLTVLGPPSAKAQIELDVNQGVVQPLPIAIPAFGGERGADIARVVAADLERSGFFRPLDPAGFLQRDLDVNATPRFADWRAINAVAVASGRATAAADGRMQVEVRLWDVAAQRPLDGRSFTATPDNWRRVAHKISDVIYERLTGQKGYFDTRIVFVAESGPKTARVKRLAIMDQDGANPSFLTDGSSIVLTPRFSRTSQEITYMSIRGGRSRVHLLNVENGRQETLGEFPGMVFAPRFSPDGGRVAFSAERAGNSDLYVMDLSSRSTRRLTSDPSIDTSPSFSPDGSRIVFTSDRGGSPQIYVMGADGGGARRISFGAGRYSTPVWSPTGDLIAFTKQVGSSFHIGVMNADGSGERLLTTSYLDEGPSWSPNGRVLMFFRENPGEEPRLWSVDLSGRNARPAPYSGGGSDPAWSPVMD
jgi:TolB protein